MNWLSRRWNSLFCLERPAGSELFLLLLLAKAVRDGLVAGIQSEEDFRSVAAFSEVAIGVEPIGWAAFLPNSVLLSLPCHQLLGWIVVVASIAWAVKTCLPYSAVVAVLAFGLLMSMKQSLIFNYVHETLPAPACLLVFCMFYVLRSRELRAALAEHRFWRSELYPRWVFVLIALYAGTYYTYSGLSKLVLGGWHAGSGLSLQLVVARFGEPNAFAQPIADARAIASALMMTTVVVETGAIVAFFVRILREIWCITLAGMHVMILLSLGIPFKVNILVLAWLGLPVNRLMARAHQWLARRRVQVRLDSSQMSRVGLWLAERLYAVDVFRLIRFS